MYLLCVTDDMWPAELRVLEHSASSGARSVTPRATGTPEEEDGDGLSLFEEQVGWTVSYQKVATASSAGAIVTCVSDPKRTTAPTGDCAHDLDSGDFKNWANPRKIDSDGDGLNDLVERELGTHPKRRDTDGDGLLDGEEVTVTVLPDGKVEAVVVTDPLDADSDNDRLTDGFEKNTGWTVSVYGEDPIKVFSDPNIADKDLDGATDYVELSQTTNPNDPDTDGDGRQDSLEANRSYFNPLREEKVVTVKWATLTATNEGEGTEGDLELKDGYVLFKVDESEKKRCNYTLGDAKINDSKDVNCSKENITIYPGETLRIEIKNFKESDSGFLGADDTFDDKTIEKGYSSLATESFDQNMSSSNGTAFTVSFQTTVITD